MRLSVAKMTRRPTCARSGQRLSPKRRSMVDRRSPTRRSALLGTSVSPSRRSALLGTSVSMNAISPSLSRLIELRLYLPEAERTAPLAWRLQCRTLARSAKRSVTRPSIPGGCHAAPKRGPVVGCFRTSSKASSASARPATIFDSAPEFGLTRRSSMPSATLPRRRS
jgi:hypothetical protein